MSMADTKTDAGLQVYDLAKTLNNALDNSEMPKKEAIGCLTDSIYLLVYKLYILG